MQVTFFPPPRRRGLALQVPVTIALLGGAGFCLLHAGQAEAGPDFLIWLVLTLMYFAPTPFLAYRTYALSRAYYRLERDGLRLRWGLRSEDIPLPEIEWIRPVSDLAVNLPLPYLRWPGAILGTRQVEGLGPVEFMASELHNLLLVATHQRIYAISPAETREFLHTFRSINEMGSLAPLQAFSIYPTFVIRRLWDDRVARWLLVGSLFLAPALLGWIGIVISSHPSLPLGFLPDGTPDTSGSGTRLLLLAVLNGFNLFVDLVAGIFFYRRPNRLPLSYVLWGASILTSVFFFIAVWYIVNA